MSAQNVFVVNCESAEGTQVVGVYLTEKLGRSAAKNYVEEYYEENVMKGKKAKSEDNRKVLYAEEKGSEKITITEVACELPVAKGKKAKKDPLAPKKGLSAYMIFAKENRERIKAENPEADFGAMGKLIGDAWKSLDETEKAVFTAKSETDKKRYETEIADYTPKEPEPKAKKVKEVVKAVKKVKKAVKAIEAEAESESEVEVKPKKAKKVVDSEVKPKVKKTKVEPKIEVSDSELEVKPKVKKAKVEPKIEISDISDSESEVELEVKPKVKKAAKA